VGEVPFGFKIFVKTRNYLLYSTLENFSRTFTHLELSEFIFFIFYQFCKVLLVYS
jgi:hypothetical protein